MSDKKKKGKKKETAKRGTLERMKLLSAEEYSELTLKRALMKEAMGGTKTITRLIDAERQEAIGFLFVDNDGESIAVVKENVWKE